MSNQSKTLLISIIALAAIGWILFLSPAEYVPEKRSAEKRPTFELKTQYVDSISYDSLANTISIWKGDSLVILSDVIGTWPQIDWNWFKKGYEPSPYTYYGSGPFEEPTIAVWEPNQFGYFDATLRIKTFRDTINNSK